MAVESGVCVFGFEEEADSGAGREDFHDGVVFGSGHAEVDDLGDAVFTNEQVARMNVAVDDFGAVESGVGFEDGGAEAKEFGAAFGLTAMPQFGGDLLGFPGGEPFGDEIWTVLPGTFGEEF